MTITPYQQILWKVLTHPLNSERTIAKIKIVRATAQIGLKYAKEIVYNFHMFKTVEEFVSAINRLNIEQPWVEITDYIDILYSDTLDYSFEQAKKDLLVEKLKSI